MDYKLNVKKKSSTSYSEVDLFPEAIINFDLDFYDVDNIDKIKVPVNVSLSLPMTDNNVLIIDYDPSSNQYNTIPRDPFDFELYIDNTKVFEGNLYVESYSFNNTIPIVNVRMVDRIQEIFKDLKDATFTGMYFDYNSVTSFDAFLSTSSGTIGNEPSKNDILFPYIDFCNDTDRFGYAQRQFIQFGPDSNKVGIIPAYKVSSFVERFFNEANVGVISRFFELGNYGTSITNNNPDDLYMLLNTKLHSSSRSRTRGFYLVEGPYEHFINEYTDYIEADGTSPSKENTNYPAQTYGWNYNPTPYSNAVDNDFGLDYKTNIPNDATNLDGAYFGSHMNYTAKPFPNDLLTGNPRELPTGAFIDLEIPMIKIGDNQFAMVKNINHISSTAKFNVVATLWKDGSPKETFRMVNTDGSLKLLAALDANKVDLSNETAENFVGYTDVDPQSGSSPYPSWQPIYIGPTAPRKELYSSLRFGPNEVGQFAWEDKRFEVEAGSTYSVSISFEWIEGALICDYVNTWQVHPTNIYQFHGWLIPDNVVTNNVIYKEDVIKAVFKSNPSSVGHLYLSFVSTDNHNPYFNDDDLNVYWSIQYSDVDPYATIKEILSRFNLSVVYDQNTQSVLIDRLPDIRSENQDVDITNKIDDAQEITVDITTKIAKSIEISTSKNNLEFDTFGYEKKEINQAGSDELKFSLNSRFYNKSLCGPEVVDEYEGGYLSDNEIGFTNNEFSKYTEAGITFGYISAPQYTTNIKRGKFIDKSFYKGLVYETLRSHVFPRFITHKSGSLRLNHFDENGDTTTLYDFFVGNDNILYYDRPKVNLTALFDKDYAFNIKDNYSKTNIAYIGGNGVIVKSLNGQLFEGGIYGEVEGIIL